MAEEDHKCAFNGPLMSGVFACSQGRQVARRGGPDIACGSADGHQRCARLFELLKTAGLKELAMEDDLLTMPHSALLKIQYGGLLGLQRQLGESADSVADIDKLVCRIEEQYGDLEVVPLDSVASEIAAYKATRRRGRNKK